MFDWSCPLDESIVYKHYWLPVLAALKSAAFPLATLTPHLRGDQLGWWALPRRVSTAKRCTLRVTPSASRQRVPAGHTPPPRYSRTTVPCCPIRSSGQPAISLRPWSDSYADVRFKSANCCASQSVTCWVLKRARQPYYRWLESLNRITSRLIGHLFSGAGGDPTNHLDRTTCPTTETRGRLGLAAPCFPTGPESSSPPTISPSHLSYELRTAGFTLLAWFQMCR